MVSLGEEIKSIIKMIPGFRSGKLWKMVVASFVYFIILIIIITAFSSGDGETTLDTSQDNTISSRPSIGEDGRLYATGEGSIVVARTKEAEAEINKGVAANDKIGLNQILIEDKAFLVDENTKVKVIDESVTLTKVRILEGAYLGEVGWVPYEHIVK